MDRGRTSFARPKTNEWASTSSLVRRPVRLASSGPARVWTRAIGFRAAPLSGVTARSQADSSPHRSLLMLLHFIVDEIELKLFLELVLLNPQCRFSFVRKRFEFICNFQGTCGLLPRLSEIATGTRNLRSSAPFGSFPRELRDPRSLRSRHSSNAASFCQIAARASKLAVCHSVKRPRQFSKKLPGDKGIRTLDPLLARQVLSQLSYTPVRSGSLLSFHTVASIVFSAV